MKKSLTGFRGEWLYKEYEESVGKLLHTECRKAPKVKPSLCSYRDNCGIKLDLSDYFNRRNMKFTNNKLQLRSRLKARKGHNKPRLLSRRNKVSLRALDLMPAAF